MEREELVQKIINSLLEQGFSVNPHLKVGLNNKEHFRNLQQKARIEQLYLHKKFLVKNFRKVTQFSIDNKSFNPENISLELREVKTGSLDEIIFRWWNLIWWSIPYQRPYGRQIRFILWDNAHNAPFGLICLQSPVLKMAVRDKFLEIPKEELDRWVNMSMHAQRVGALPPYNELLGGKLVALTLTCNEIREVYKRKYTGAITLLENRKIEPYLLFITTTSAFGRSSIYNRLKFHEENIAYSLGFTKGTGTFHVSEELYKEILDFLSQKGYDIARGLGHGPSRKLKLISLGLRHLGLSKFEFHGIKREFYLFPLVKNLKEVVKAGAKPIWYDRPFERLVYYWKDKWAIPRTNRKSDWKSFESKKFFEEVEKMLKGI
ncbi:MAG: DUF4338 domain-containing protein [Candidatus Aenigmatarchaeota archaeon]